MATINSSTGGFSKSFALNCQKALEAVNAQCYKITRELFLSIVELSPSPDHPGPTAKGVLVNNWFPVDGPSFSTATTSSRSRNGSQSISRINALQGRSFLGKDGVITLNNNLHYAYRAEVLGWPKSDGWSGRISTPYRMVALSLQKIGAKYK